MITPKYTRFFSRKGLTAEHTNIRNTFLLHASENRPLSLLPNKGLSGTMLWIPAMVNNYD